MVVVFDGICFFRLLVGMVLVFLGVVLFLGSFCVGLWLFMFVLFCKCYSYKCDVVLVVFGVMKDFGNGFV